MHWILIIFLCLFSSNPLSAKTFESKKAAKNQPTTQLTVTLQGLSPTTQPLVEVGLSIKNAETEKKLNEDRIESLHQVAPFEITRTLEALGYYHATIQSALEQKQNHYFATYDVKMGRPTLIKSLTVKVVGEGSNHPLLTSLIAYPALIIGNQITHQEYENYKQQLLGKALQSGFLNAVFHENKIEINKNQYEAHVILILDTGPQFKIGKVEFQENPYPREYLERYLPFEYGTTYTTEKIAALQKSITDTDLFRIVRVDANLKDQEKNIVPLMVRLKPKARNRYTGSLGYGTDTGARGMFWWEHRRMSHPGHKINSEIQVAKWKSFANLRYSIPGANPKTDRLVFALRNMEEKYRDGKYSLRSDVGAVQIKRIHQFERMIGLHYLISERYRELPGFPKKNAHYFIPSLGLIYTNIEKKEPQQEGYRLSLSVRGAMREIASTTSFVQTEFRMKSVYAILPTTRILLRSEIGAITTKKPEKISLSLRYFTGGDQTVRGYGYKSLGPRKVDAYKNDIVVGGQYLAVGSVELEQKIYQQFSGACFFDVGQAMNKWRTRFARSVGVGIRYQTPLGPLRIDVAQGLVPITERKQRPRIHFSFGMDL